jgi:hypothetical protein
MTEVRLTFDPYSSLHNSIASQVLVAVQVFMYNIEKAFLTSIFKDPLRQIGTGTSWLSSISLRRSRLVLMALKKFNSCSECVPPP